MAPSGCVTGSARYLFLIRPDGDCCDDVGGQVKCDAIGPADDGNAGRARRIINIFALSDGRRRKTRGLTDARQMKSGPKHVGHRPRRRNETNKETVLFFLLLIIIIIRLAVFLDIAAHRLAPRTKRTYIILVRGYRRRSIVLRLFLPVQTM